jgi:hypothetical protein
MEQMTPLLNGGEMKRRQNGRDGRMVNREGERMAVLGCKWQRRALRFPYLVLLAVLLLPVFVYGDKGKSKLSAITVRAFHLLYPDYSQTFTVGMKEKVQLVDTNLFVAVEEFVPHFAIDTVTRKVFSQSPELKNPAFRMVIYAGAEKKEEQWAFFKFAVPHFTRQTGLRFEVLKFNYNGKTYRREKAK